MQTNAWLLAGLLTACGSTPRPATLENATHAPAAPPAITMDSATIAGDPAGPQFRMRPSGERARATPPGPFGKEAIRLGVDREYPTILACYEHALGTDPSLAGSTTITFVVAVDGTVSSATTPETSAPGIGHAIGACVAEAIKAAVFPAPATATSVIYPLVFRPKA